MFSFHWLSEFKHGTWNRFYIGDNAIPKHGSCSTGEKCLIIIFPSGIHPIKKSHLPRKAHSTNKGTDFISAGQLFTLDHFNDQTFTITGCHVK